uniref:Uncharacterized protein n=1 Tax=Talaromyces marneffei PM1 TaxID=1077442 RepID=A0A093VFF9_TALMA
MAYSFFIPRTYILALLALVYGAWAAVLPARDTVTLPPGVTYDPNTNVWCTPTTWIDVASFFLGNYISHAATVISFPGEPVSITIVNMVLAIFLPSSGAGRGLLAMVRHAAFYKDPIQQALRSRALCMVVRSQDWKPISGETLRSLSFLSKELRDDDDDEYEAYKMMSKNKDKIKQYAEELKAHRDPIELRVESPLWLQIGASSTRLEIVGHNYQVFGTYKLPDGYELAYVPANAVIEPVSVSSDSSDQNQLPKSEFKLSSAYSFASALVSIVQIIYALTGLYRSRGDQVPKYGYAAFSFTVLPYVIMSFVNLLGNLVTPRYSTLYLVHTEMMDEASQRGVEDTFVFSAALKESSEERWEFQLGEKIYFAGEVEPMATEKNELAPTLEDEHVEAHSSTSAMKTTPPADEGGLEAPVQSSECHKTNEEQNLKKTKKAKKDKKDKKPLLICPNCYRFQTIEERRGKFLSIANPKQYHAIGEWLIRAVRVCIVALPLAVIGGMTQFKTGSSTVAQRAWTMSWLAVGMGLPLQPFLSLLLVQNFTGLVDSARKIQRGKANARIKHGFGNYIAEFFAYILCLGSFGAPAIGGFIVVAQMLRESASCEVI